LDAFADELLPQVTEHSLSLRVDQDDLALLVDDHHRIRRRFHQIPEPLLRPLELGGALSPPYLQGVVRVLNLRFGVSALACDCRKEKSGCPSDTHESLRDQEAVVWRTAGERADVVFREKDRDSRDDQAGERCARLAEAKRRPDQRRKYQIGIRTVLREDQHTEPDKDAQERAALGHPRPFQAEARTARKPEKA